MEGSELQIADSRESALEIVTNGETLEPGTFQVFIILGNERIELPTVTGISCSISRATRPSAKIEFLNGTLDWQGGRIGFVQQSS
jgi:hypothetical protein